MSSQPFSYLLFCAGIGGSVPSCAGQISREMKIPFIVERLSTGVLYVSSGRVDRLAKERTDRFS